MEKGEIGETIIRSYLEGKGWVVYQPLTNGPHCFDMLSIKDKNTSIAIDVKAKAALNKWPATGVNLRHFEEYQKFSVKHNMKFFLAFVDEMKGEIYGNSICELEKERTVFGKLYPFNMPTRRGVILRIWPLEAMNHIAHLRDSDVLLLKGHNQRSYKYTGANPESEL